jgi:hypothetical protein
MLGLYIIVEYSGFRTIFGTHMAETESCKLQGIYYTPALMNVKRIVSARHGIVWYW